ncbi:MAG TPA: polysaccharide biosynthesis C-terminal domain-containing protein, partial [Gammaproteobacteria bacterium]|nr:polysaccharide biosynthesis C-terminal domain-containing protein [Gammaproteobacteria bacterium]
TLVPVIFGFGAVMNVAFCFALIPPLGAVGAATAAAAAPLSWMCLAVYTVRRKLRLNPTILRFLDV